MAAAQECAASTVKIVYWHEELPVHLAEKKNGSLVAISPSSRCVGMEKNPSRVMQSNKEVMQGSILLALWQKEIENDRKQEHHSHAVVSKHGADDVGEYVEHACGLCETESHREGKADDDGVAL